MVTIYRPNESKIYIFEGNGPQEVHTATFVDFFGPSLSRPFQRFACKFLRTMGKVYTIIPQNDPIHLGVIMIQIITKTNCMSSLKVLGPIV